MAVTNDWTRFCKFTVNHLDVSGDVSDFPTLLNQKNVALDMITSGGANACNFDASDIRITTDSLGVNEYPFEVVTYSLSGKSTESTIEIHIKIPSVSTTVDTNFYIWYHNTSATAFDIKSYSGSLENVLNSDLWNSGTSFITSISNGFTKCIRPG